MLVHVVLQQIQIPPVTLLNDTFIIFPESLSIPPHHENEHKKRYFEVGGNLFGFQANFTLHCIGKQLTINLCSRRWKPLKT